MTALLDRIRTLLQGEPLRAIVYGAAVVVFLVTHIAIALGYTGFGPDPLDIDKALAVAAAAAALLTEFSRLFVTPVNPPS